MNGLKAFLACLVFGLLAACGGGGGSSGTNPQTPSTPVVGGSIAPAAAIELQATGNTVPTGGGTGVVLTAVVKNSNGVGMAGQTVTFSTDSGTLQLLSANGVTSSSGVAQAALNAGGDKSLRSITVRARVGTVEATLTIAVTGTKIKINGDLSAQLGSVLRYSVKLTDSAGADISNQQVKLTSSLGNVISNAGVGVTDFNGVFTFLYTANTSGIDIITATGLGTVDSISVNISAIDFAALSPSANTTIPVNSSQAVTVRYRVSGVGQGGQNVSFSSTRGTLSAASAITNGSGEATVNVSSASAGLASVVANIAGVGQVTLPIQFVATVPTSIALQANPGAVLPNAGGSTSNQATLEAIVRDANGNSVANRAVSFNIVSDASGGVLSASSAITDINGRASVQFIPGANSTASNGVIIRATVPSNTPLIASNTSLTVNGESLFITIAFGNVIDNLNVTTYRKPFSVYVTDANGIAVGNKTINLRVIPQVYGKGALGFSAGTPATPTTGAIAAGWGYASYLGCPNEDTNLNGSIDPGEDINNSGSLEPGLPVIASPGVLRTDVNGFALFDLLYGEQFALWLDVRLEARASVGGTESVSAIFYSLEALASDLTNQQVTPANIVSPFGRTQSCLVAPPN